MSYKNKKILITGGLGFIGSNLARNLVKKGAKVTLVDNLTPSTGGNEFNINDIRNKVLVKICDVNDFQTMEYLLKDQNYLFNLAAQTSHIDSILDPKKDLEINTIAQLSILEICKKINPEIKVVFTSTRQIYGKPRYFPVDEKHPNNPTDANGINKLAGESYHLLYNKLHGLRACSLRLTNTYGPGMRISDARQNFLGIWIRLLLEKKPIKIFGDGSQLRDFNYIDDCVDALLLSGLNEITNGKVYNLGSSEVIGLKDLAEKIFNLGYDGTYDFVPFPKNRKSIDIGDYYSDFSLISSELGWLPNTPLADGLKKTIEYYRLHSLNYFDI